MEIKDFLDAAQDLGKIGGGGTAAFVLYRLFLRVIDYWEVKSTRDQGARNDRVRELEALVVPLSQKAALADHLELENQRLREEDGRKQKVIDNLREVLRERDVTITQKDTVIQGMMPFLRLMERPQVHAEMKKAVQEEKAEKEQQRKQSHRGEPELTDLG